MVLDPIPQSLPVHFFGSRPQPPTSLYGVHTDTKMPHTLMAAADRKAVLPLWDPKANVHIHVHTIKHKFEYMRIFLRDMDMYMDIHIHVYTINIHIHITRVYNQTYIRAFTWRTRWYHGGGAAERKAVLPVKSSYIHMCDTYLLGSSREQSISLFFVWNYVNICAACLEGSNRESGVAECCGVETCRQRCKTAYTPTL